mmetsp:Transcript_17504/g.25644  ORF Transcript_17504/g.25644 Transcript_17504/m.25644 type:complete len:207 (+) Transcript_17504:123-743(+)|eukprot:CAMPEP_0194080428 /NCGR_PEP_ID=MMETSP0149-20130528/6460_1 /TAXON_ID=122233 /ORGANISM="Chaetoceros debilis, Strain MM31A-1" /LENGTH=206 /DNA_ID=CAMNT_0038762141 /DNA_START=24 /DNA_END=644 /DNA_ORIENTATION=-
MEQPAVKVVLLGNCGAGKSSIAQRFVYDQFNHYSESTIGASFFTRIMQLENAHGKRTMKFHVWDTAGQEKYHALAPMYYRGAMAAVLVYDIVSVVSFHSLKSWLQRLREFGPKDLVLIIVGNKCDLHDKRQIPKEEAESFSQQEGCIYIETSARDGIHVELVFEEIARSLQSKNEILSEKDNTTYGLTSNKVDLEEAPSTTNRCMC